MKGIQIRFGDREFTLPRVPIETLLDLAGVIDQERPAGLRDGIERALQILDVVCPLFAPALDPDGLRALRPDYQQIDAAASAVLRIAGLLAGEAEAESADA